MSASIGQSCNKTNKTNKQNKLTTIFLPKNKINKVFFSPILQNLRGSSVLDNFFENNPLDEPKRMPLSKKFCIFRKLVKNAKWWSKSNLPLSHSPNRKTFPFKKGFKKSEIKPFYTYSRCMVRRSTLHSQYRLFVNVPPPPQYIC